MLIPVEAKVGETVATVAHVKVATAAAASTISRGSYIQDITRIGKS